MSSLYDRDVARLTPNRALLRDNLGQVVHTIVRLSPSSIISQRRQTETVTADYMEVAWFTSQNIGRPSPFRVLSRHWESGTINYG